MQHIMHVPLLDASWITTAIDKLSAGGVGAFFVLLFLLFLGFAYIIKQLNSHPSVNIPKTPVVIISGLLAILFSSFAFILLMDNKGGGDGGNQKTDSLPSSSFLQKENLRQPLYASLTIERQGCEKRDVFHKLTFDNSKPFYVLINAKGVDNLPNQLALLSIADDGQSASFHIGQGAPFTVKLNTPATVIGGGCSYQLTFTEVVTQTENLIYKRKYAHYTLTPVL